MTAILVVDDDPKHGDYVTTLLRRRGLVAEHVNSAWQAMQKLGQRAYAVVITDLLMPDSDGIELLRDILNRYPGMAAIGMTGSEPGLQQTAARLMTAMGVPCLLPKPIVPDALFAALDMCRSPGSPTGLP